MRFKAWNLIGTAAFTCLLSACSVFTTYPNQMQDTRLAMQAGNYKEAIKYVPMSKTFNADLNGLELGRLEQLNGQYQESLNTYNQVVTSIEAQNLAPKIQVSKILSNSSAILVNDNVIPYRLSGYEIVLLYQYQALNYLALGDEQNALVFMRKAQLAQTYLKEEHYKEIVKANDAAKDQSISIQASDYPAQYAQMMQASSAIKSSFMNPFSDYLASLLYAARGEVNNSVVSLKNALDIAPNNTYLQNALLLAMQAQGGDSMLKQYLKAYGKTSATTLPPNAGTLAVIYEQGFIPAMREVQVPIPVPGGIVAANFPYYDSASFPPISPMSITANNQKLGETQLLTNNALLAQKSLAENYPLIMFRIIMRFATQTTAMVAADQNNNNGVVNLGIMLYSWITANADLRSWLSLPDNVQIMQVPLSAGSYQLGFSSQEGLTNKTVKIEAGKITLLWLTGGANTLNVSQFNL